MKAKLIKSLRINGKVVSPKAASVILVDLDEDEFDRLSDMGKVAKPTSDELKIGKLVGEKVEEPEEAGDGEVAQSTRKKVAAAAARKGGKPASEEAQGRTDNDTQGGADANLDI